MTHSPLPGTSSRSRRGCHPRGSLSPRRFSAPPRLFAGCAIAFTGCVLIGLATAQTRSGAVAATIACLPFAPTLVSELPRAGTGAILWTTYLGAFPTAIGFATWAFALSRTRAGALGTLTYLAPVVALLLGWLMLGEIPHWLAVVGGALALGGVYESRRPASRPKPAA